MKLFWKIFSVVFIAFITTVSLISYVTLNQQILNEKENIIDENRILGSFIAEQIEIGYLESKWPFDALNKLTKRDDFIFWWVVMGDGTIHLANNASFVNSDAYSYFPELSNTKRDEDFFVDQNLGFGVLITPLKIGTENWSFWLGFSMKKISEIIVSVLVVGVMIILFSLMTIGFVLYFIIVYFTKPINSLLEGTNAVAKGNLKHEIKVKSRDEIGELASAFNQMTKNLEISQERIKKHTGELEAKVQERTKDLDTKITELTATKTAVLNMMDDMDETNKELVKMQDELKRSLEELRKIDIEKDEFISIAAHELKTPLTSIRGFSQLLMDMDVSGDPDKMDKYLRIIDSETKRVARLVTDILDLSRMDLGTFKLSLDEVDIKDLVESVQREMNVQITEKGLNSSYVIEPDIPKIVTDKERLTQILLNLINNAVKYTPSGKITVRVSKEKGDVHFTIKDTGIGISKEKYDKLFHRFYQIDSSYTRKAGGTGLGLALCKEFVTMMGGRIWFESELGKGSEFHFTLPIKNPDGPKIKDEKAKAEDVLKRSEDFVKKAKP
jgi:signal transduction histidine kinase